MKNINKYKIFEMAYSRSDAIDRCASLGKQFIKHFIKIMDAGGINDPDFIHHCDIEMFSWLNEVKNIRLKPKNKALNSEYLMDWFFTTGSSIDVVIPESYEDVYSLFVVKLLADKTKKVSVALTEAINEIS